MRRIQSLLDRIAHRLQTTTGGLFPIHDGVEIRGRIDVAVYDVQDLRDQIAGYDELEKPEKHRAIRDADVSPIRREATTNTTVDGLHEYIVDNLDGGQAVNESASHLAVGTSTTAPTSSDAALGNEVYRTAVTDVIDNGKDLTTSTFLDSTEANGNTLAEVGLYTDSAGGTLLNHALINAIAKDSTKTATIDVELQFRAA